MAAIIGLAGYAIQAMQIASMMLDVGKEVMEVKTFLDEQSAKVTEFKSTGRNPSEQDWAALNAIRDQVHAEFQKPQ